MPDRRESGGNAEPHGRSVLVKQAAELLGVSLRTVYYRIREGKLRTIHTRCGSQRVLLESIESLRREEIEKKRARSSVKPLGSVRL